MKEFFLFFFCYIQFIPCTIGSSRSTSFVRQLFGRSIKMMTSSVKSPVICSFPPTLTTCRSSLSLFAYTKGSTYKAGRVGERQQPCLEPLSN